MLRLTLHAHVPVAAHLRSATSQQQQALASRALQGKSQGSKSASPLPHHFERKICRKSAWPHKQPSNQPRQSCFPGLPGPGTRRAAKAPGASSNSNGGEIDLQTMQNIRHTQQMPEFGLAPHNPILFFFLTFWCPDLEPLREMALCTGVVIFKNHSRKWLRSRSRRGGGGLQPMSRSHSDRKAKRASEIPQRDSQTKHRGEPRAKARNS